jgi:uncharacterized membrane protein YeaQ/YmgE (transglycosylase-associated protein family)
MRRQHREEREAMIAFILYWIIVSAIAGFLANKVVHAGHGIGFDIVLGIVGVVVGGIIAGVLFGYHASHVNVTTRTTSVIVRNLWSLLASKSVLKARYRHLPTIRGPILKTKLPGPKTSFAFLPTSLALLPRSVLPLGAMARYPPRCAASNGLPNRS